MRSLWRVLSPLEARVRDLILRAVLRILGVTIYRIVACHDENIRLNCITAATLPAPRELTRAELLRFSQVSPEILPPEFVARALDEAHRCIGVTVDRQLIAYAWFSRQPPKMQAGLKVRFNNETIYQHKTFVLARFRRFRLSPWILQHALTIYRTEGVVRVVAYFASTNRPSLRAAKRVGFRKTGNLYIWRLGRGARAFASSGCVRAGLSVAANSRRPVAAAST